MPANGNFQGQVNNLIYSKKQQSNNSSRSEQQNPQYRNPRGGTYTRTPSSSSPGRNSTYEKPHEQKNIQYREQKYDQRYSHEQIHSHEKENHIDEDYEEDKKAVIKLLGVEFFLDDLILIGVILIMFFWLKSDEKKDNDEESNDTCSPEAKEHSSIFDKLKGNNLLLPILLFLLFDDFKIDKIFKDILRRFRL